MKRGMKIVEREEDKDEGEKWRKEYELKGELKRDSERERERGMSSRWRKRKEEKRGNIVKYGEKRRWA